MLPGMPRILMPTHVPPWPPVESALLHMGDVVGHQVVAEAVTLIHRAPQVSPIGIDGQSDSVANSVSVYPHPRAVRVERQYVSAILFLGGCVRIIHIRTRTHRHKQGFSVQRELYISCPMPAAAGQVRDVLDRSPGVQVAVAIRKTYDRIRIADIHPLRPWAQRIEGDPERPVQPAGEDFRLLGPAVLGNASK